MHVGENLISLPLQVKDCFVPVTINSYENDLLLIGIMIRQVTEHEQEISKKTV